MGTFVENVNLIALAIDQQLDAVRKVILKGTVPPDDRWGEDGDKYMYYSTDSVNFYKEYTKHKGHWVLLFDDAGEWLHADGSVLMHADYVNDVPTVEFPAPRVKQDGSVMYKKYVDDADILIQGNLDTYIANTNPRLLLIENEIAEDQIGVAVQIAFNRNVNNFTEFSSYLCGSEDPLNPTDYGLPYLDSSGKLTVQRFLNPDLSVHGIYQEFIDTTTGIRWYRTTIQLDGHGWEPWVPTILETRLDQMRTDIDSNTNTKLGDLETAYDSARLNNQPASFYAEAAHDHAGVYIPVDGTVPFDAGYLPVGTQEQYPATVKFATNLVSAIDYSAFLTKDGLTELDAGYIPSTDQGISTKKYVDDELTSGLDDKYDKTGGLVTGNVTVGDGSAGNTITVRGNGSSAVNLRRADNSIAMALLSIDGSGVKKIETYDAAGSGEGLYTFEADGNMSVNASIPTINQNLTRKDYVDGLVSGSTVAVIDGLGSQDGAKALSANQGYLLDQRLISMNTTIGEKLAPADLLNYGNVLVPNLWEAAQKQAVGAIASSGTIVVDVSITSMTKVVLTGASVVLGATGAGEGLAGSILVTIDPGATISFDSTFRFPDGVAPTLEGTSVISYVCYEIGYLICTAVTKIPVTPPTP